MSNLNRVRFSISDVDSCSVLLLSSQEKLSMHKHLKNI